MEEKLLVGYARVDITPEETVPLAGYGNTSRRLSQNVRDPLYATCLAFTDSQGETALLYTTDLIRAYEDTTRRVRAELEKELGLPRHKVMIASTHTHSGPDLFNTGFESVVNYKDMYVERLTKAAKLAMADRKEAKLFASEARPERMNFVRHYKMADGTYAGSNFGRFKDNVIVDHTSPNDPQMPVVKIAREGGEDIVLMNWAAHPCFTGGLTEPNISADYIAEVRKYIEEKTGMRFAFFQGAAGNQNARSKIEGEHRTGDPVEYGALLGEYALQALENAKPVASGKVQGMLREKECTFDHSDDDKIEYAREVRKFWLESFDRPASCQLARKYGMNSPYAANSVISRYDRPVGGEMVEMGALTVGDLAFACAPYEMFAVNGVFIKENSPFENTFVVSCCNQGHNYLASEYAFEHGCYEVDQRKFPKGTAEALASTVTDMLKEMK